MQIFLNDLASHFGSNSEIAKQYIPLFYNACDHKLSQFKLWKKQFLPTAPEQLKSEKIAKHYQIKRHNAARLIFALQSYYATVIKLLAGSRIGSIEDIESVENGLYFRAEGIQNFTDSDVYSWYLNRVDVAPIMQLASICDFENPVPDALKALYHDLFSRDLRHTLGEYYTPDWFANFVLDRVAFTGKERLLDPTCGSGTFLILAYRRMLDAGISNPLSRIAGIDINPLACLSAKANLILNMPEWDDNTILPVYCSDTLINPPEIGTFDLIIGNPPWVNWETLPGTYRNQTKSLWEAYGLFPHSGFDTILGKGKKDLSLVLTYAVIDRYLSKTGTLAFIMTQSVLKTGGAAEGFRRFDFGEKAIKARHVDDFSKMRLFSGAETKPIVLILSHDAPEKPTYYLWQRQKKTIKDNADNNIIDTLTYSDFIAEPVDDVGSAWLTGKPSALKAVRKIVGKSDYHAHAGVYTGGANAVYWLDILARDGNMLKVRNIVKGSKRAVPEVEAWIEADLVYPLLRGRDVSRWQANPTVHILMVQNPETRQGYDLNWLRENYPHTFDYLAQFEATLRERATFKRYFRDDTPFYTMFDIGDYTFLPYKVVWHGFGKKRMHAVVVSSVEGKAIMSNQAMHPFVGLENEDEAHYLAGLLNSAPFEFAVLSHTQPGGKSFAQPGILETLRLPQFEKDTLSHQTLVRLSRDAHRGKIDDEAIAQASASVWDLTASELLELQESLLNLIR